MESILNKVIHSNLSLRNDDYFQEPYREEVPRIIPSREIMIVMNGICALGIIGTVGVIGTYAGTACQNVLSRYVVFRAIGATLRFLAHPLIVVSTSCNSWYLGEVMCKFASLLTFMGSALINFYLVGMCINTFLEICVRNSTQKLQSFVFKVVSCVSWPLAFAVSYLLYRFTHISDTYCVIGIDYKDFNFVWVLFYFTVPLLTCWILITLILCQNKQELGGNEKISYDSNFLMLKKRTVQLTVSVTVFFTIIHTIYEVSMLIFSVYLPRNPIIFDRNGTIKLLPYINDLIDVGLYYLFLRDAYNYVKIKNDF